MITFLTIRPFRVLLYSEELLLNCVRNVFIVHSRIAQFLVLFVTINVLMVIGSAAQLGVSDGVLKLVLHSVPCCDISRCAGTIAVQSHMQKRLICREQSL